MKKTIFPVLIISTLLLSTLIFAREECDNDMDCADIKTSANMLGWFNKSRDLFLPQFDSKTDVDDIHSIAALSTMLSNSRFSEVKFHAVAGAYGTQSGEYVPATDLFNMAFGKHWSDAHNGYKTALDTVTNIVIDTLNNGGDIWIAEAGQSDFSADMVRQLKLKLAGIDTNTRIHIVQHSEWNQENTTPVDLEYVKSNTDYHKIADGNATGNGTPGLRTDSDAEWSRATGDAEAGLFWTEARGIANKYNGKSDRYNNVAIELGGMDFSDASETCWIFGFLDIYDVSQFFDEFGATGIN